MSMGILKSVICPVIGGKRIVAMVTANVIAVSIVLVFLLQFVMLSGHVITSAFYLEQSNLCSYGNM